MFGSDEIKKALEAVEELKKLNRNLEIMHEDTAKISAIHQDLRSLASGIRDLGEKLKTVPVIAKHLSVFNQIMLQVSQKAGTVGVIHSVIDGFTEFAKRAK